METEEVNYYKPRFARWIKSNKWTALQKDYLMHIYMEIITMVMNAEKDGDCSWIIWSNCDYVLNRIRNISKEL